MHQAFMKVAVSRWDLSDADEVRGLLKHCIEVTDDLRDRSSSAI